MVSDGAVMLDSGMKASRTIWNVLFTPQTSYGPRTSPFASKSSEPAAPSQLTEPPLAIVVKARVQFPGVITVPDRKSTRLNSSHLVISYAVFCLKKKKQ